MFIFLSASVPFRAPYAEDARPIEIRDAVRALASSALLEPDATLVWGGHPSIDPMVRLVGTSMGVRRQGFVHRHVTEFFEPDLDRTTSEFEHLTVHPEWGDRAQSLEYLRSQMIRAHPYAAAFFVGGMDGVIEEWKLFGDIHPHAKRFALGATGGAARELASMHHRDSPLQNERAFPALIARILPLLSSKM